MTATTISPRTKAPARPICPPSEGDQTPGDHQIQDAHLWLVAGVDHRSGQEFRANHRDTAAAVEAGQGRAAITSAQTTTGSLFDPALALAADVLDDIERVRTANASRFRQLTRTEEDSDGEERGFGLDESHPDVARLAAMIKTLEQVEHDATLNLRRLMRKHPLGPWAKAQKGIGDKQIARLLAAIGDPYWNSTSDCPRTVSALWAYCGLHVLPAGQTADENQKVPASRNQPPASGHHRYDTHAGLAAGGAPDRSDPGHRLYDAQSSAAGVAPKRQRGTKANWSTLAKTRAYLISESCMKQLRKPCAVNAETGLAVHVEECECSPYRLVYDATRAKYAAAVHGTECTRCGPKGKPAQPGSPLSASHKQARALRAVSKALLKDLWREAKRIHTGMPGSP